jgi:hypothetical protein
MLTVGDVLNVIGKAYSTANKNLIVGVKLYIIYLRGTLILGIFPPIYCYFLAASYDVSYFSWIPLLAT